MKKFQNFLLKTKMYIYIPVSTSVILATSVISPSAADGFIRYTDLCIPDCLILKSSTHATTKQLRLIIKQPVNKSFPTYLDLIRIFLILSFLRFTLIFLRDNFLCFICDFYFNFLLHEQVRFFLLYKNGSTFFLSSINIKL